MIEIIYLDPFTNNRLYRFPKVKQFADDNFKFDEKGKKFYTRVENTVRKEEIAHYGQFLLFPQCF